MRQFKLFVHNTQSWLYFCSRKMWVTYHQAVDICLVSLRMGNQCVHFSTNTCFRKNTCSAIAPLAFDTRKRLSIKSKCLFPSRMISKANLISHFSVLYFVTSLSKNNNSHLKMQRNWATKFLHSVPLTKTYEETVAALNGLQSNAATILKSQQNPDLTTRNMTLLKWFMEVLDIQQEDLKSLNIIHVAGTKGKGSTCAFTESILRSSGFKTGFFSSPHLVVVRERIRINGKPLSQSDFVLYFWQVYNKLSNVVNQEDKSMPPYFMFLTLMAFHVFLNEKVDVAVLEVGVGGEYDCTNVLRHPAVVGITSIGLDHLSLLGDTVEKIAWQKAGILKEGVPAFTVQQPPGVLHVFLERAAEKKCSLSLVPSFHQYYKESPKQHVSISAEIQEVNISLALQLSHAWIERYKKGFKDTHLNSTNGIQLAETFDVCSNFENGLRNCIWLGRFQKLRKDKVMYFLDGAHTFDSVECCAKWFQKSSSMETLKQDQGSTAGVYKVLIFNCTRDRKPENLLSPLADIHFDLAIFCTNNVQSTLDTLSDLSNFNADREKEIQQCLNNMNMWQHLQSSMQEEQLGTHSSVSSVLTHQSHTMILPLVSDTLACLENPKESLLSLNLKRELQKAEEIHVLVTGSLHLVGAALSLLDPEMQCS